MGKRGLRFTGCRTRRQSVPTGSAVLGRTISALGFPIVGEGPAITGRAAVKAPGIIPRQNVTEPILGQDRGGVCDARITDAKTAASPNVNSESLSDIISDPVSARYVIAALLRTQQG